MADLITDLAVCGVGVDGRGSPPNFSAYFWKADGTILGSIPSNLPGTGMLSLAVLQGINRIYVVDYTATSNVLRIFDQTGTEIVVRDLSGSGGYFQAVYIPANNVIWAAVAYFDEFFNITTTIYALDTDGLITGTVATGLSDLVSRMVQYQNRLYWLSASGVSDIYVHDLSTNLPLGTFQTAGGYASTYHDLGIDPATGTVVVSHDVITRVGTVEGPVPAPSASDISVTVCQSGITLGGYVNGDTVTYYFWYEVAYQDLDGNPLIGTTPAAAKSITLPGSGGQFSLHVQVSPLTVDPHVYSWNAAVCLTCLNLQFKGAVTAPLSLGTLYTNLGTGTFGVGVVQPGNCLASETQCFPLPDVQAGSAYLSVLDTPAVKTPGAVLPPAGNTAFWNKFYSVSVTQFKPDATVNAYVFRGALSDPLTECSVAGCDNGSGLAVKSDGSAYWLADPDTARIWLVDFNSIILSSFDPGAGDGADWRLYVPFTAESPAADCTLIPPLIPATPTSPTDFSAGSVTGQPGVVVE